MRDVRSVPVPPKPAPPRHDIESLYRVYGPLVLRRGLRFLSESEAEELVHDVFLKLLENPERFRGESSPATWLYQVATRMCIDRIRRRSRRAALQIKNAPILRGEADRGESPEARVFLQSLWQTVDEELALIGVLHYVDGLTTADIGKTLGVSDRTVANRLKALAAAARTAAGEGTS